VTVSAGACSDWQTWQTVSGAPWCSCRKLPPPAKYNNARHSNAAPIRRNRTPLESSRPAIESAYTPTPGLDAPIFILVLLNRHKSQFVAVVIDPPSNLPYPRSSAFMRCYSPTSRWLTVFLALLLLGAQFHFCADFAADSSGSHICQFCATASHAVVAPALLVQFTPAVCRFETRCSHAAVPSLSCAVTSPRAPPSL
jgi:hypothetical protein